MSVESIAGDNGRLCDGNNLFLYPEEEEKEVFAALEEAGVSVYTDKETVQVFRDTIFGEDGEIIPSLVGGGTTQFFCDYLYSNIPTTETLRGVLFGGAAHSGAYGGLAAAYSSYAPSHSATDFGSRLCFIPATA